MPIAIKHFVQVRWADTAEFHEVLTVAERLRDELNTEISQRAIAVAHAPRAHSTAVQASFIATASELGFRSEAKGLFAAYESRLRPDYFLPLGLTGILLEVERGKTTTNNMDMLDFWKCHLCPSAHYLFLFVPQDLRHGETGFSERPFVAVTRRLATFFHPGNYTNVRALVIFGY